MKIVTRLSVVLSLFVYLFVMTMDLSTQTTKDIIITRGTKRRKIENTAEARIPAIAGESPSRPEAFSQDVSGSTIGTISLNEKSRLVCQVAVTNGPVGAIVTFTNGANGALNFTQTSPSPPQSDWPLGQFSLTSLLETPKLSVASTSVDPVLNSVVVTLGGTYDAGDLGATPFRLFASNTNNFGGASAIGSDVANPGSGSDVTFSSLSDVLPWGTRYYWVTADISASATSDDNINGTVDAPGDLSISNGNLNDEPTYGKLNAGTDVSLPVELVMFSASCTRKGVLLQWATESETDNLGYILDCKTAFSGWQQIASYQTHEALKGAGNTSSRTEYAFIDVNVFACETYAYRLSDIDFEGAITVKDILEIMVTDIVIPEMTVLEKPFPNPFNPQTKIAYKLAEDSEVTLTVRDLMGRAVAHILQGEYQRAGSYSYFWHGKDNLDRLMPSGIYLLVLEAGMETKAQKVMFVK